MGQEQAIATLERELAMRAASSDEDAASESSGADSDASPSKRTVLDTWLVRTTDFWSNRTDPS